MKKRKRQKEIPGGIVKIPFDDGWHTYGRILNYGDLAIYDLKTQEDITDLDYIISRPILFKCIVNDNGVKRGKYPIIGIIALETSLEKLELALAVVLDGISCAPPRTIKPPIIPANT